MTNIVSLFSAAAMTAAAVIHAGAAAAAPISQTFVSHGGQDANPCTESSPCRTLATAFTHTQTLGEIVIMDAGDFGPLRITHGVTIINEGPGVASSDGIVIEAGYDENVTLRGLTLDGPGRSTGILHGIGAGRVGALIVDHCNIHGYPGGSSIYFSPDGRAKLQVMDSVLSFTGASNLPALFVLTNLAGVVSAEIERVRILNSPGNGVRVDTTTSQAGTTRVELRDVTVTASGGGSGIVAVAPTGGGPPTVIVADHVVATGNAGYGLRAIGGSAQIFLHRSTIIDNGVGINASSGGSIFSAGDNVIAANTSGDGVTPTAMPLK